VATYQASNAPTARLRALFSSIAADEREHALLAHRVHAWGRELLDQAARDELGRAFEEACERIVCSASTPLSSAMGEPSRAHAGAAFRQVIGALAA
jgi:hypothetical protein